MTYSPALLHLLRDRAGEVPELVELSDESFYWNVEEAVRGQFRSRSWLPEEADWAAADARLVLDRLSDGWFGRGGPTSPQARYADTPELRIGEGGRVNAEKPERGLWTACFFPSGQSTWDHGEMSLGRPVRVRHSVHYGESSVSVHVIDSPEDFARLVTRFPRPAADGRVRVDWDAVGEVHHAVHLTAKGLLTADRVPVTTPHGTAELWGWGSQSTVWLRLPDDARVVPGA
ncbi:hypothetical protein [Saccharothrix obliqua]|uniref:hypothetical protein n=1 Tax=Saccharothrix obliqua TaxID=2861747 RepID=UPI001C5E0958|nr:hypothetical protein [Saccharothrix obliqua]MBW4717511.1 hypothetical protein [Saccharothrix obliqua]